jgi:hypothetical protein
MPGADHRECGRPSGPRCAPRAAGRYSRESTCACRRPLRARYEIEQADNGEMHATYREQVGKDNRGGEIVIFGIDGFAYRSREKFPIPATRSTTRCRRRS